MDVEEAIETRIEVRKYADGAVPDAVKRATLEAGRLAPSGRNLQHWRFVLLDDPGDLSTLAERSPTGGWVAGADFAVAVLTDPAYDFHRIDAGRAVTQMQFAAWKRGVGSCIYTVDEDAVDEFLGVPEEYEVTLVAGFGYPARDVVGRKSRKPLADVAFHGRFGDPLDR